MEPTDRRIRIAPSILSADFARLGEEVRRAEAASADWIHVDAMDGCFVPNITLGPIVAEAVRRTTSLIVDAHLMLVEPERYVDGFANAGADVITVHAEACRHLSRTLQHIRGLGKKAGVAINPHTPESALMYVLDTVDLILVMSVNPGFGGQPFIPAVLPKLRALRRIIDDGGYAIQLSVDGGVNPATAAQASQAGADVLVAGSSVFGAMDYASAIAALREGARPVGPDS